MMMIVDPYRFALGGDPYFGNVVLQMDMQQDTPFLDFSSHAHTVTKYSGAVLVNAGAPWGNSLTTTGETGARLSVTSALFDIPSNTEFTVEVVLTRTATGNDRVLDFGNSTYLTISPSTGAMLFRHSGGINGMGTLALNTPTHLAVCLDMAGTPTLRGFVGGVPVFTATDGSVFSGLVASGIFQMCAYYTNGPWEGRIHAFRFTSGVCRYRSAFTPPVEHFPVPGP
jgi:hypothetical protein